MARRREEEQTRLLERGEIGVYYRPRLETFAQDGLGEVQRLLIVLCPERRSRYRIIAIGRKRLPEHQRHERFWGFVDLVLDARQDLQAALAAQTYGTKTPGIRHLPAAHPAASGSYTLSWHGGHANLQWRFSRLHHDDEVVRDLSLRDGSAIVTVANPDPAAWGLSDHPPLQFELFDDAELHVTIPTPFHPALQSRFGERRFVPLDSVDYLDHPGAELVFIAS